MTRLLLSVREVAEAMGVSDWTVRELIRAGELGSVTVGTRHMVPVAEVRRYITDHYSGTANAEQAAGEVIALLEAVGGTGPGPSGEVADRARARRRP